LALALSQGTVAYKELELNKLPFQIYEDYLDKCKSPDTRQAKYSDLKLFNEHLGGKDPVLATKTDLETFITKMQVRGLKPSTLGRRIAVLKKFYSRAVELELMEKDPSTIFNQVSIKPSKRNPKALSQEQREHLLKSLKYTTAHDRMVSLMVFIGLYAGFRINEIRKVQIRDLDFKNGTIKTIGKGDKERVVPMAKPLIDALQTYLRGHVWEYLFCKEGNEQLRRETMVAWAKTVKTWCGWDGRTVFSCHVLRHSFVSWLIEKNVSIEVACELAGHSSIEMTRRYTKLKAGLATSELKRAFEN